ncbi:cholesterol esterase, partial [Lobaria immixta]|nr:cholesterol esterase [Lobaria immixta]
MDQFAFHDIPDSINYILTTTSQPSLSYVGFSQGTAQAFATLSIHPTLNDKVDVFVALAPAMSPAGLHNSVVDALMKASPEVIFLAFGRRSILSSATMWQYDDDVQAPLSLRASDRYYKVAKFPTRNIKTPIVLVYGGSDSLVDINVMLRELPKHTVVKEISHFEHLDFLWAQQVETLVFPHVYDALETYAGRDRLNEKELAFKSIRNGRFANTQRLNISEDDGSSVTAGEASDLSPAENFARKRDGAARKHTPRFMRGGTPRYNEDSTPSSSSSTNPTTTSTHSGGELDTPTWSKNPAPELNTTTSNAHKRSGSLSSTSSLNSSAKKIGNRGISIGASKAIVGGVNSP